MWPLSRIFKHAFILLSHDRHLQYLKMPNTRQLLRAQMLLFDDDVLNCIFGKKYNSVT